MSRRDAELSAAGAFPVTIPMTEPEFENAVTRAGDILRVSRSPVIVSFGADVAGIVAAFRLARTLGAAIDHAGAEWALRDQAVLQDIGLMLASPGIVRERTDTLLLVGDRPLQVWPEFPAFVFADRLTGETRAGGNRVIGLTSSTPHPPKATSSAWLKSDASVLPLLLAALRARVNGRPLARDFDRAAEVEHIAEALKASMFGVALWCPDELDTLAIEMLTGLIKDLNAATRWSGISVSADTSVTAAVMASGWMTGLPLRTTFAKGRPRHDPWQYDARRLVQSGEADAVVCISAFGDPVPDWVSDVPAIVIADPPVLANTFATVLLPVGRPGTDHDGVVADRTTGTLVEVVARSPRKLPTAAEALTRIIVGLGPP